MDFVKSDIQLILEALNIQGSQKVIALREDSQSDANFLVTHIIKYVTQDRNRGFCLLALQNSPAHYQYIGRRLNFNLSQLVEQKRADIIDPMKWIADEIGASESEKKVLIRDTNQIAKNLFAEMEKQLKELLANNTGLIYVIVDNLSILLDMGLDIRHALYLINMLLNFDDRVNMVINTHVGNSGDRSLATAMSYISDMIVSVGSLKTGKSPYVTGVIGIQRVDVPDETYHYKATERGIKIFQPGEMIQNLA